MIVLQLNAKSFYSLQLLANKKFELMIDSPTIGIMSKPCKGGMVYRWASPIDNETKDSQP